jgi:hypothetical protein
MKEKIKQSVVQAIMLGLILGGLFLIATANGYAKTNRKMSIVIGNTCTDIQNTINNSATGTTIYLTGTYTCDVGLIPKKDVRLLGTGTSTTRLVAQKDIGGIVYDYGANTGLVEIAKMTLDVNKQSKVVGIAYGAGKNFYLHDIEITNCLDIWCGNLGNLGTSGRLIMDRVTVSSSTNATYEGVLVTNMSGCLIQNNLFTNLTQGPAALALYVGTANCVVRNNNYANNTIRDFYSSGADNFLYTGNKTTASPDMPITARGVQIFNTRNAIFSRNYIEGQNNGQAASGGFIIYDYSVDLDGHSTGAWATSSNIIIENNIINKSYSGVSMPCVYGDDKHYEKSNIIIRNNTIIDPLWKAVDIGCPNKTAKMDNITITGNVATGTTRVFDSGNFSITGQASSSITNVVISNNTGLRSSAGGNSSCVFIAGASGITLKGNKCDGVSKGTFSPIQIDASTTNNVIIK